MASPARTRPESSNRPHAVAAGEGERPPVPEASAALGELPAYRTPDKVAILTGVLSAGIGTTALALPPSRGMAFAAALSFIGLGLGFVAMGLRWRAAALWMAVAVGLSDLAVFVGHPVYGEPGLDARALSRWWPGSPFNQYAMNPDAALGFVLVAAAVLLLTVGRNFRWRLTLIVLLGSAVVALGLYGVAGRLTGLQSTYGMGQLTGMVYPVAGGLVLLGAGVLAESWQQSRQLPTERQLWILVVVAMTGIVTSTSLWRALLLLETLHFESVHQLQSYSAGAVLLLGLLATALLGAAVYLVQTSHQRVSAAERLHGAAEKEAAQRKLAEQNLARMNAYNRSLIEASIDPLVTIGTDGKITDVNAATEAATGCSRQELIGTDFCDYFTEPDRARAGYQQAFREGGVRDYALEISHRDGHITPVLYNASVYHDSAGAVIGVFAAARDITERKRLEEELRARQAYTRSLIEASLDPLVTISPQGKITDVNGATEAVTGCSRTELVGTDFWDYFTDPERARAGYQQVFREGSVHDYELELHHRSGCLIPVLYNASVYRDQAGAIIGVFAAARDVTERKRLEEELRQLAAIVEFSDDAIISKSLDGTIVTWNKAAERLYGYAAAEAVGKNMRIIVPSELHEELTLLLQRVGRGEFIKHHDTVRLCQGGGRVDVSISLSPVKDSVGRIIGVSSIGRDITERKRLEEELQAGQSYTRSLIEASLDPLVTISSEGKITDVNRATEAATGFSRAQLVGSDFSDYFTEPDKARAGYQQVFAEGLVEDYPLSIRHCSGRVTEVLYNASVFRNRTGEVAGVFAAARDITERKRLEQELQARQAYTRSLIEASLDPLVTISSDGKITDVNAATEEVTGLGRAELIGSDFCSYFMEPDKARAGYQQVFAEGLVEDYPLAIRHRSGRVTEVLYNASVFLNEAGEVEGVFAAARDITERKRLEDSLRQRTLELENSVAELEAFSYSVSHDLRAPLRSIDGFSQILLEDYRDKVDAEGQDSLRRIRNASQNMAQLIDALLQLSRVMRSELRREPVDLSVLALSTAAMIQKAEPARRVRFRIINGLQASGDRRLLGVALQNLLQNAWKFSARNPEPAVEFGSMQENGKNAYYVRDNGIGFDMTYVNKLFTPFQRLHAKEQFEGTGIGLATVQRVIKRHGGKVWAEGAVGKGATFYFSLD